MLGRAPTVARLLRHPDVGVCHRFSIYRTRADEKEPLTIYSETLFTDEAHPRGNATNMTCAGILLKQVSDEILG
jgi:hypothetical protein